MKPVTHNRKAGAARWAVRKNWLLALFLINFWATLLHFLDNIVDLHAYPDLPTTRAYDIALYWLVMTPFGIAGYVIYQRYAHRAAYYLFYIYCVMNLVVVGHYTQTRLQGSVFDYEFKVHLFIWLEVVTALALLIYVVRLHWADHARASHRRGASEKSNGRVDAVHARARNPQRRGK
jgi:hypothetical protein